MTHEQEPTSFGVPSDFWSKAPRRVANLGYSVLILLTLTSLFLNMSRGRLGAAIITLVVVFGLLVAFWAFRKMSESNEPLWKWTGRVAGIVVLSAMIAVFCTVLLYIASGYPIWMDRWFGPAIVPAGPSDVRIESSSRLIQLPDQRDVQVSELKRTINHSTSSNGLWPVISRASAENVKNSGEDNASSIVVRWNPNVASGVNVEVSLMPKGVDGEFPSPQGIAPAQAGMLKVEGLKSGTVYRVRVVSVERGRYSEPVIAEIATDAFKMSLPDKFRGYNSEYTGKLVPVEVGASGVPNGAGMLEITRRGVTEQDSNFVKWNYEGEYDNGLIVGKGKLSTDPQGCQSALCGSECVLSFEKDRIASGKCALNLPAVQVPDGSGSLIYSGAISRYQGEVAGAQDGKDAIYLGPFRVVFSGRGKLTANDKGYSDEYDGLWNDGVLVSGTSGNDHSGTLETGQHFEQDDCFVVVTPMSGGSIGGFGGKVTCGGVELGKYRGDMLFDGFELSVDDGVLLPYWIENGQRMPLPLSTTSTHDCISQERWGLPNLIGVKDDGGWTLRCEKGAGAVTCYVEAPSIDLSLMISAKKKERLSLLFRTSGNARDSTTPILLKMGQSTVNAVLRQTKLQKNAENIALLAEMCGGDKITNEDQNTSIDLGAFCPLAAIALGRVYSCN